MTNEQKNWLDTHRAEGYRIRGNQPGGNAKWIKAGMLHADGSFEAIIAGRRPPVRQGSFEVGILQASQPIMGGPQQ